MNNIKSVSLQKKAVVFAIITAGADQKVYVAFHCTHT